MLPAHANKCFSREENYATEACGWHDTRTPLKVVCGVMQPASFRVFCKTEVPCAWRNKYLTYAQLWLRKVVYIDSSLTTTKWDCCVVIQLMEGVSWPNYFLLFFIFFSKDDTFASWLSLELSTAGFNNTTCTILFPMHMRNNLALANKAHTMIL